MIYYAIITYAIMCSALTLGLLSFVRIFFGTFMQPITRGIISICVFVLSLMPIQHTSIAMIFYSVFDMPSFLLLFICLFSILRTFINQIGFIMGYRGFLFIAFLWLLFMGNAFGIFEWAYGSLGYRILLIVCIISIAYCIDRVCGIFMLMAFALWLPFSNTIDIYDAMFDSVVALFGWFMQSMPLYRNNFHVALLKPKFK